MPRSALATSASRRAHLVPGVLASLGAVLSCGAEGPLPVARPVDTVILVSIDSLRADRLGAYGHDRSTSPRIDALAREGLLFERAYSTTSWTLPAHAALLTGLDDYTHDTISGDLPLPSTIDTLAEQLGHAGVHTTGFFSGPYLHPAFGVSQGFDEYVDCTSYSGQGTVDRPDRARHDASHRDVTNPILIDQISAWLSGRRDAERASENPRRFIFIHMWDVHYDYIAPQRYVDLFDPDYAGDLTGVGFAKNRRIREGLPARDLEHLLALYDAEIRYTDDTLGELLDLFEAHGMLDRSAVIITSDHGEEFLEHGGKGHGRTLEEEVLHVPLLLQVEGKRPVRATSSNIVSLIDIAPTVCDLLDVPCQAGGAARSLWSEYWAEQPDPARGDALAELTNVFLRRNMTALLTAGGRVVRWNKSGEVRYYGSADDGEAARPALRVDVQQLTTYPDEVRKSHDRLIQRRKVAEQEKPDREDGETAPIDESTRRHLEALGYIDGS